MINVAKTAGFCYGVKRAVDDVYKEIENGKKIATLGPLIHNRQVIEDLASKGVYAEMWRVQQEERSRELELAVES